MPSANLRQKWSSMSLISAIIEVAKYASYVCPRCSQMPFKIVVVLFTMFASTSAAGLLLCVVGNCNTMMILHTAHNI